MAVRVVCTLASVSVGWRRVKVVVLLGVLLDGAKIDTCNTPSRALFFQVRECELSKMTMASQPASQALASLGKYFGRVGT